jgi:putative hydrolase of the HAD superfamily
VTEIRGVLLDLGHTLVDYEVGDEALLESYQDVHRYMQDLRLGTQPIESDLLLRVSKRALDLIVASYDRGEIEEQDLLVLLDEAFRHHGWHLEPELVEDLMRREHAAFASHLFLSAETRATLETLRQRGLPIGIVSNATIPGALMREDLELLGLDDVVNVAVFSSEIGVRKPDRRIFDAVLDALELDPRHCLFVGDRLKEDVGGSRALGMHAVLTHEFRQETPRTGEPVEVITQFAQLLPILDSLARA